MHTMSLSFLRLLPFKKSFIIPTQCMIQMRNYAGFVPHKAKRMAQAVPKIQLPVEKDVNKLVTYACGTNIYKTGEDVKLKPDSEYPEWLWTLRTEPVKLSDLDPNTKQYWRYLRKANLRRNNKLQKTRGF